MGDLLVRDDECARGEVLEEFPLVDELDRIAPSRVAHLSHDAASIA
jgi:hypothetical protein